MSSAIDSWQSGEQNMVNQSLQILLATLVKHMYRIETFEGIFDLTHAFKLGSAALLAGLFAAACGASPGGPAPADTDRQQTSERMGNSVTDGNLPISKRFRTLDEYLAFLEATQGPVGGPWYKQVSPGLFQLQTGNLHLDVPGKEERTFTREELEKRFGFSN